MLYIGEADYNPTMLALASGLWSSGSPGRGAGGQGWSPNKCV